jgi:hypothetical protein
MKSMNLREAETESGTEVQVYSDRLVLTLVGNPVDYQFRTRVYVHIEWRMLPWLMRSVWAAWWKHKTTVLHDLEWQESELRGTGVRKP